MPTNWQPGSPQLVEKLQTLPELRDVASDQQTSGLQADLVIDRDTASRLGITAANDRRYLYDAFGQRQISTIFTQLNQYHVVLEVEPAAFSRHPRLSEDIYVHSSTGDTSSARSLHAFRAPRNAPLAINHQGQFPVVTISFNLAPGRLAGRSRRRRSSRQSMKSTCPPAFTPAFQGTAAAFQNFSL